MSPEQPPPRSTRISRRTLLGWGGSSVMLSACGGGGDDGGTTAEEPGGGPGPGLPAAQRLATLDAVAAEYERLCAGGIRTSSDTIAAFMRARPEYRRVTVMPDGCVCGEFTDGQIHVVANNLRTGLATRGNVPARSRARGDAPTSARAASPASTERQASPLGATDAPPTGIPASPAGICASSFINYANPDDGSAGDIDRFENMLQRAGVDVLPDNRLYVDTLKALPELGFFSWLTHGGMLREGGGGITHALMTSTPADIEGIVAHLQDLQAGNLVYYTGQYLYSRGQWSSANYLAITPAFIQRYNWRFSANSIVLIHACASDFAGFRNAFQAAGAGVYGGWSHPVWVHAAVFSMHWMLDKFIASNRAIPTPSPRNRPHAHDAIKRVGDEVSWMLYEDPEEGGNVEFRFTQLNGDAGYLLPSMARMEMNEADGRLSLYGSFGSIAGRVYAGTTLTTDPSGGDNYLPWRPGGTVTELTVHEWSASEVIVDLPRSGAGSAGYIAVQVGRRWSNARALTRWNGQMQIESRGPGTLLIQHTLQYSGRCDIGLWRDEPDGTLQDMPRSWTGTPFAAPSTWTWAASGQHVHTDASVPETTTVQWSGTHRFELPQRWTPLDPQYYSVFGMVNRSQREFCVAISGGAGMAMPTVEVHTSPNGTTRDERRYSIGLPLALSPVPFPPGRPGIVRPLADNYTVEAGSHSSTEPTLLPLADPDLNELQHTMAWDAMTPEYLPNGRGGA
jgi:hypothetical protein